MQVFKNIKRSSWILDKPFTNEIHPSSFSLRFFLFSVFCLLLRTDNHLDQRGGMQPGVVVRAYNLALSMHR